MKIIGKAGKEVYIAEVTRDEVAQLRGFRQNCAYRGNPPGDFNVGDTVEISEMYNNFAKLAGIREKVDTFKDELRLAADFLDGLDPKLDECLMAIKEGIH